MGVDAASFRRVLGQFATHRADANAGMRESGLFAVNVLAEDQEDVSRRFAAPGRGKTDGFPFAEGKHGLPLVPGALAHVECRVRSFHDEGDHAVWVARCARSPHAPGGPSSTMRAPTGGWWGRDGVASPAAIGYKS